MPNTPLWLWHMARWSLALSVALALILGLALAWGLADPPRAGPLLWDSDFRTDAARWDLRAPAGATLSPTADGLVAEFTAPEQLALALTSAPTGDFTLETGGAQIAGEPGAAYGVVFGWQDETHYSAVLINGNGYAEAYRQNGAEKEAWFVWGQWPHILAWPESNRVRVDVRGARFSARVNDELLVEAELPPGAAQGRAGVVGRSFGAGQIIFNWARWWGK